MTIKPVIQNRKALHDYEVLRRIEAGLALTGSEIKSIRAGNVNIREAYVRPEGGEMWLVGAHVAAYGPAAQFGHDPTRRRRLLLHKQEIRELTRAVTERGLTLVPLSLYLKNGMAKVEVGLVRGKRQYDKREAIKKREAERQIARVVRR